MNKRLLFVSLIAMLLIFAGIPDYLARPQYLANLTAVYGSGSCSTCHVMPQGDGQRNFNGMINYSNATFERRNSNRTLPPDSNGTSSRRNSSWQNGTRNLNRALPRNSYGMLFESQPGHATDPDAALKAIGQPPAATSTPGDTPEDTAQMAGTKAAPGFGIVLAMAVLFACVLMARRHNK